MMDSTKDSTSTLKRQPAAMTARPGKSTCIDEAAQILYEQCKNKKSRIKNPNEAGAKRGNRVIDKLAETEIYEKSLSIVAEQKQNGFKLRGMSHPRMDFKAINQDRKTKFKQALLTEGKGYGYYYYKHRENDAGEVIERCVRDGAMADPKIAQI
jgi:hypothetical protein